MGSRKETASFCKLIPSLLLHAPDSHTCENNATFLLSKHFYRFKLFAVYCVTSALLKVSLRSSELSRSTKSLIISFSSHSALRYQPPHLTQPNNIQPRASHSASHLHLPALPFRQPQRRLSSPARTPGHQQATARIPLLPTSPPVTPKRESTLTVGRMPALTNSRARLLARSYNQLNVPHEQDASFKVLAGGFAGVTPGVTPKVTSPHTSRQAETSPQQPSQVTMSRPWTPPDAQRPLTAALTSRSLSFSEAEFSADGSLGTGIQDPYETQPLSRESFTYLGEQDHTQFVDTQEGFQDGRLQGKSRSVVVLEERSFTCADVTCFPGVHCELGGDGKLGCGRCPLGYIGDGRTCRGNNGVHG